MSYRVVITAEVERSIIDQVRFIAVESLSPQNADRWIERVMGAIDSLEQFPRRCPIAPEYRAGLFEVRVLQVRGYLVFFDVDDEAGLVRVIGARHGRQQQAGS